MTLLRALGLDEGATSSEQPSMMSGDHALSATFQSFPAMSIFRAGPPQGGASRSKPEGTQSQALNGGMSRQRKGRQRASKRPGAAMLQSWLGLREPSKAERPAKGSGGQPSKPLLSERVVALLTRQRQRQRHRRSSERSLAAETERQHTLQVQTTEAWLHQASPRAMDDAQQLDRAWVAVMGLSMGVVAKVLFNGPATPVPAMNDQHATPRNDMPLNQPRLNHNPAAPVPQNEQRRNEPAPTWVPPTQRPAQRVPVAGMVPTLPAHAMHPFDTVSDPVQLGQHVGSLVGASHQARAWFERPNAGVRAREAMDERGLQAAALALDEAASSSPVPRPGGGSF